MSQHSKGYIVGAYATAPSLANDDKSLEDKYYQNLIDSIPEIGGFEIPFWGDDIHRYGADYLLQYINPNWNNVMTCIPASVMGIKDSPHFGIASNNEAGRLEAVTMHKRANKMVHKINERAGRNSILAVQVATAPSIPVDGVSSSADSLKKSLEELLSWDWCDSRIVIEHCDYCIDGSRFEKGFMSLEDEIEAIISFREKYKVGLMLNWARSAIEGKSPARVIEHIKLASKNNLLSGFIFSGTAKGDAFYGSWKDTHMPFAKCYDESYFEKNSLLTKKNIKESLSLIDMNKLDYLGIKLLSMPMDSSPIERRVGLNKDAVSILNCATEELALENNS